MSFGLRKLYDYFGNNPERIFFVSAIVLMMVTWFVSTLGRTELPEAISGLTLIFLIFGLAVLLIRYVASEMHILNRY